MVHSFEKTDKRPKVKIEYNSMQLTYTYLNNFYELYLANIWRHVWSLNCGAVWLRPYSLNPLLFVKYGLKLKNKKNTFFSNFTIKMALLSLEQLLRGVFVIATPPTMDLGTSEEYWHIIAWFYSSVTHLIACIKDFDKYGKIFSLFLALSVATNTLEPLELKDKKKAYIEYFLHFMCQAKNSKLVRCFQM